MVYGNRLKPLLTHQNTSALQAHKTGAASKIFPSPTKPYKQAYKKTCIEQLVKISSKLNNQSFNFEEIKFAS